MDTAVGRKAGGRSRGALWPSRLALLGIASFTLAVVALHFLRTDHDPTQRFISEYAVGPYGALMTAAFCALGSGSAALILGLVVGVGHEGTSIGGLVLLGIWSLGVFLAAAFPIDVFVGLRTIAGAIHGFSALVAFCSLVAAVIAFSRRLKLDDSWRSSGRVLGAFAILCPGAFAFYFAGSSMGIVGLTQRVFFLVILSWLSFVAWKLNVIARGRS